MLDPCGYLKATAPASVVTNGTQPSETWTESLAFFDLDFFRHARGARARTMRLRILNFGIRGRADGPRRMVTLQLLLARREFERGSKLHQIFWSIALPTPSNFMEVTWFQTPPNLAE